MSQVCFLGNPSTRLDNYLHDLKRQLGYLIKFVLYN